MAGLFERGVKKALYFPNKQIGKFVVFLEEKGWIKPFPYSTEKNFGPVIRITHPYPENYQQDHKHLFEEWKSYDTFPLDIYKVRNVNVSTMGIVFRRLKHFVKAMPHPVFRNQYGTLYLLWQYLSKKKIQAPKGKKYILLFDLWSQGNYFHWTIDSLCRIHLTGSLKNYTVILPEKHGKFIDQFLKIYGAEDILWIREGTRLFVDELIIPNYPAWSGQQHPHYLTRVRNFLLEKTSYGTGYQKIYASRGKQRSRRIGNEDEVWKLLEQHGFTKLFFEDLTVVQQIEAMKTCRYFVTSHGANMTNILFLPAGAKILELINNKKPNFCYWSVASCINLAYYYQLCPISEKDHITVDTEELSRNLSALLP